MAKRKTSIKPALVVVVAEGPLPTPEVLVFAADRKGHPIGAAEYFAPGNGRAKDEYDWYLAKLPINLSSEISVSYDRGKDTLDEREFDF